MDILQQFFDPGFIATAIRLASPILLAALGGVLSERAGVYNIALEGMMLMGAMGASLASHYTQSPLVGLVAGAGMGSIAGLVLAVFAITLRSDQIITGLSINLFALGATTYIVRQLFGVGAGPVQSPAFEPVPLPVLGDIPVLGRALFSHQFPVYIAYLLVPVVVYFLFYTRGGLTVRSVGESARAAAAAGVPVRRVRYFAVITSGLIAGLGGAILSVALLSIFTDNMTNGRGYIAVAAIIFGNWRPLGILIACLLFGATEALSLRILGLSLPIPYQFPAMLPFLITIFTLVFFKRRSAAPAEGGKPYTSA